VWWCGEHLAQGLGRGIQLFVPASELIDLGGQFIDPGQPLVQQVFQPAGVLRLDCQRAVRLQELQLQHRALSLQL